MWRHSLLTNSFLMQLAIMLLVRSSMSGQQQPVRYQISQSAVAELLTRKGLTVYPSQVHLPTRIGANNTSPELTVISVERLGSRQMLVGVRCERAGDCLPFNATIDVSNEDALAILKNSLSRTLTGNSTAPQTSTHRASANISVAAVQRSPEVRVKLGSPVTLVIRDGLMEIHLPAIAVDSGSAGMRVRVRTVSPEKTFYAVVLDQATVLEAAK